MFDIMYVAFNMYFAEEGDFMEQKLIEVLREMTGTEHSSLATLYFEVVTNPQYYARLSNDGKLRLFQHTVFAEETPQLFEENSAELVNYFQSNF